MIIDARMDPNPLTHNLPSSGGSANQPPKGRKIATIWNLAFRLANFALLIARNFALVPIALRYVGTYEYSTWLAGGGLISQLTILDMGLTGVVQQQAALAHGAGDRPRLESVVGTGMVAIAILSCCIVVLGAVTGLLLPDLLSIQVGPARQFSLTFIAASIAAGLQVTSYALGGVLTGMQRPVAIGVARVVADLSSLALTVFLMMRGLGLVSIGIGMLVRSAFELATTTLVFKRVWGRENHLGLRVERSTLFPLFRMSLSQFLSQVAGRMRSTFDPLIIGAVLGVDIAASYTLTTRAHEAVRALLMQFAGAIGPAMTHLYGEGSMVRFREISTSVFRVTAVVASIGMGAIIFLNESFVAMWVGQNHYAGNAVTIAAAMWGLLSLMGGTTYDQMIAVGEFKRSTILVWMELVVRAPVFVVGLLTVGVVAIPASSVLSQALVFNWRMTKALLATLKFPPGSAGALHGLLVRHALMPFALGVFGLFLEVAGHTWVSLVAMGAAFVVVTALASYAADPSLRVIIRKGTI